MSGDEGEGSRGTLLKEERGIGRLETREEESVWREGVCEERIMCGDV